MLHLFIPTLFACVLLFTPRSAAAAPCETVPAPVHPLRVDGFYADRKSSIVSAERAKLRAAAVAPYEAFIRQVQQRADDFARTGDREAADCALRGLSSWAHANALAGPLGSAQADYERNWYLAGLSLAYLKLRPATGPAQSRRIEGWLVELGRSAAIALDRGATPGNNLLSWAGLALAAAGLATDDRGLQDRASAILREGTAKIAPDRSLPLEMARGAKALDYHAFAAAPLVILALIETSRGGTVDRQALTRLVDRIRDALSDDSFFAGAAGVRQQQPELWNLAWFPAYRILAPDSPVPPHAETSHFLGGDVAMTIAAILKAQR